MSWPTDRVHRMDGFVPAGRRVRAVCSCGHGTTPRADEQHALEALVSEHGQTAPRCAVCGRDYDGRSWEQLRDDLQILTDPDGGEFLACRGAPPACRDGAGCRSAL
jgi:hypothetical protein